tara:strand:- start:619 stop:867 length:249 start_codon:yes stop_codon:yes gene_type:complete
MQEIIITLAVVSLLDAIMEEVIELCLKNQIGYRNVLKTVLNRKPFICEKCMGFWIGVILAIILGQYIFLTIPIIIRIKNSLL